ncbi:MAG: hypothetical protein QOF21_3182, partial [Actinomycetota bacterium]
MGLFRAGKLRRGTSVFASVAMVATLVGAIGLLNLSPAKAALDRAGQVDLSFSTDGVASINAFPSSSEHAVATVVDHEGRPVVLSFFDPAQNQFRVSRFNADGSIDTSFGFGGAAEVITTGTYESLTPQDMIVDSNNNLIVLAIASVDPTDTKILLAKFVNGDLDGSFGLGGIATGKFGTQENSYGYGLTLGDNDKIIVAGAERDDATSVDHARLMEFGVDGTPDPTFGTLAAGEIPATDRSYYEAVKYIGPTGGNNPYLIAVGSAHNGLDSGDALINRYEYTNGLNPVYDAAYPAIAPDGRVDLGSSGETASDVSISLFDDVVAIATHDFNYAEYGGVIQINGLTGNPLPAWNGGGAILELPGRYPESVSNQITTPDVIEVGGRTTGSSGFVGRLGSDGLPDPSFGEISPGGFTDFVLANTAPLPMDMAIDQLGRAVFASSDGPTTILQRFTNLQPSLGSSAAASKLLFTDGDGTQSWMYAKPTYGPGVGVVGLGDPGANQTDTSPIATESGSMYFEHRDLSLGTTHIFSANSADGGNRTNMTPVFGTGGNEWRPTYNNSDGELTFLYGAPGAPQAGICARVYNTQYDYWFNGQCDVSDLAGNPVIDKVAFVRDGDLYTDAQDPINSPGDVQKIVTDGNIVRAEWGMDGTVLVYETFSGGNYQLWAITWPDLAEVYYSYNPINHPTPAPTLVLDNGTTPIRGFAVSPDVGTGFGAPAVFYGSGVQLFVLRIDGEGGPQPMYAGGAPSASAWPRNLGTYREGSDDIVASHSSIHADAVPLQSKSPGAKEANGGVEPAGIIKLDLLGAPILKLDLLKAGILKLDLLGAPILKLDLLKAEFGFNKLGLSDDLGSSPRVRDGLKQITLATMPILSGPGWRERLTAPGMSAAALELSRLPLQEVSLYDVLQLNPKPEFPGVQDIDLSQGLFGRISVLPFLLGDTRLSQIDGIDWCGVFEARGSDNCGAEYGVQGDTARRGKSASLMSLQIAGFNLDNMPATPGHPVNDLREITYGQVSMNPANSILPNIVLSSISTHEASIGGALVKEITPSPSAVVYCAGDNDVPATVTPVDCSTASTVKLDTAKQGNALRAGPNVAQMGGAITSFRINELALGIWGTPGDDPYDQPPEALGINTTNSGAEPVYWNVVYTRTATGPGATENPLLTVDLPAGFKYLYGSASIYNSETDSEVPLADPDDDEIFALNTDGAVIYRLTLTLPTTLNDGYYLRVRLGTTAVTPVEDAQLLAYINDGFQAQAVGADPLSILDQAETGPDYHDALKMDRDTLYFGRLDSEDDIDYFKIQLYNSPSIAAGSTVTVYLSQLRYDADLTVYHPEN